MKFTLSSSAIAPGQPIPIRYTCDGKNVSPPLAWTHPPAATKAFALLMDDPDAPSGTFTHWMACDLPGTRTAIEEGAEPDRTGIPGINGFSKLGYGGPCPPRGHGPHRYRFHLLALDTPLRLKPGYSRAEFDAALRDVTLDAATLVTTYERKR